MIIVVLEGGCQIWHPDRTHAALEFRPPPQSPERFHLQAPKTDTGWDDQYRKLLFTPRHDFFSLDAGALISDFSDTPIISDNPDRKTIIDGLVAGIGKESAKTTLMRRLRR